MVERLLPKAPLLYRRAGAQAKVHPTFAPKFKDRIPETHSAEKVPSNGKQYQAGRTKVKAFMGQKPPRKDPRVLSQPQQVLPEVVPLL